MNFRRAFRVWQRHVTVYKKLYKSSITINFIEPVLYLTAMGFGLGAFVEKINGVPYINYIAPGIIAYSSMFAATFECTYGTYIRMTHQKTFDAILATPVNVDDLVVGEILWGATKSLIYGTIITFVISVFGLVQSPMIVFDIPFIFLCGIIFAEISVCFSAVIPSIEYFNYFYTLFLTPMFLFSGIFFPLDKLPAIITKIAFFTPLYHIVNIIRSLSYGSFPVWDAVWMIAVSALLAPCAFRLMRRRVLR